MAGVHESSRFFEEHGRVDGRAVAQFLESAGHKLPMRAAAHWTCPSRRCRRRRLRWPRAHSWPTSPPGWDGTLWSVDTDGVPHLFDPLTQSWHTFGAGFDAVAWLDGTTYAFQGESVLVNGVLESSAGLWSHAAGVLSAASGRRRRLRR